MPKLPAIAAPVTPAARPAVRYVRAVSERALVLKCLANGVLPPESYWTCLLTDFRAKTAIASDRSYQIISEAIDKIPPDQAGGDFA